jgi:hypothetical protein
MFTEHLMAIEPGRKEYEVMCLTKAKETLQPLREAGVTHGQLEQLWGLVTKELDKRS